MTEEEMDTAHEMYEEAITMLKESLEEFFDSRKPSPEAEDYIRMKLNDEMRYWK